MKSGALARTLSERPNVQLLINHDGMPLARTANGSLQLSEDNIGLRVNASLNPKDPDVQRLIPKMRRGDLNEMSFAGSSSWYEAQAFALRLKGEGNGSIPRKERK